MWGPLQFISDLWGEVSGNAAANRTNIKLTRETNRQNAEQARLNRLFQSEESEKNRAHTIDMWNRTNEYNSPSAQMERMQAAGLNPFTGDYNSQAATNPSSPTSSPSGSLASFSAPHVSAPQSNPVQGFQIFTQALKDLSESGLSTTKKNDIALTMEERLRGISLDNDSKTLINAYQKFINDNSQQLRDKEIEHLDAMISELVTRSDMNDKSAQELVSRITKNLEDSNLSAAKSAQLRLFVQEYAHRFYESQISSNNSSADRNRSEANYFDEKSETEKDMRPYKVESASNNAGPETDYQAIYSLAAQITEDADKARMVTGIIAGIHEVKDIGKTVADIITSFKKLGIQMKDSDVRKLVGMRASRKVTWKRLSDEGNMLYSYD